MRPSLAAGLTGLALATVTLSGCADSSADSGSSDAAAARSSSPSSTPSSTPTVTRGSGPADGGFVPPQGMVAAGHRIVRLSDGTRLDLFQGRPHARGGAQWHLFATRADGSLAEVTAGGDPVLPFIAADTTMPPTAATCTPDGGIAVYRSEAHRPTGVVLAWDVTKTTYAVSGTHATAQSSTVVRRAAADPALRRQLPVLFRSGSWFADCSRLARR